MNMKALRWAWAAMLLLAGAANAGCYRDGEPGNIKTICTAPSVSITSPVNGAALGPGVALQVNVSGSDPTLTGLMNKIELYRNSVLIGTKTFTGTTQSNVVFAVPGMSKGVYGFQAKAYDGGARIGLSQNVQVTVGGTSNALTSSTTSPIFGQLVTLTSTISGGNPTGTVTFKEGASTLQTVSMVNGSAVWTASLSVGLHTLTAVYSGDASNLSSQSLPLSLVVTPTNSANIAIPHMGNANAGLLAGKADVRAGKAGYLVPLPMPPGVAGMVPSVALDYNGGTSNGVVGVGWALSASSSIHRCGPTIRQDGRVDTVRLNGNDRLCLDGKRLIASAPGDAEYRTELETYTRVVPTGNGFTVYTRDGRVQYYGGTTETVRETMVNGVTPTAHTWTLRRVEDRAGNAMEYAYSKDATTGEQLLTRIRWGSNSVAGQAAFAKAEFAYESRPDTDVIFVAAGRTDMTKRLATVSTWTDTAADGGGGVQATEYRLQYHASPTSGRSLLHSLQACSAQDGCLPATSFTWGEPDPAVARSYVYRGEWNGPVLEDLVYYPGQPGMEGHAPGDMYISADFDGDGRNDLLTRYGDKPFTLFRNTGASFAATPVFAGLGAGYAVAEHGDFDGDGQTDVLVARGIADLYGFTNANGRLSDWRICFSRFRQGQGFQCVGWPDAELPLPNNNSSRLLYDFNGDGRDDIYLTGDKNNQGLNPSTHRMCLANGTGFTCSPVDPSHTIDLPGKELDPHTQFQTLSTDLDGDGRLDILKIGQAVYDFELTEWLFADRGIYAQSYDENAGPYVPTGVVRVGREIFAYGTPENYQTHVSTPATGDINGDGYSDLIFKYGPTLSASQEYRRCLGNGLGGLFCQPISGVFGPGNPFEQVADYDGDGSVEVVATGAITAGVNDLVTCAFNGSTPTASACAKWTGWAVPPGVFPYDGGGLFFGEGNQRIALDLTGDGRPDRVHYRTGGYWGVLELANLARSGEALDRIVQVTDGHGLVVKYEYALPGDASAYIPDATDSAGALIEFSYPQRRVPRMGHLVRALKTSNGQGGWIEQRYTYSGGATDHHGHGNLGFARIDATDVAAGITSTNWYSQSWPHIGNLVATRQSSASGVRLSETSATLAQQVLSHASGKTTRFAYTEAQQITKRDLDGSLINTTATGWTYGDGWGNATQVSETVTGGGKTFTSTTTTAYQNDASAWLIGLPTRTTISKTRDGVTVTRTTSASYETNGLPKTQTIEPDDLAYRLVTTLDRSANPYGLVNKTTQAWRDPATGSDVSRTTSEVVSFDAKGRFALHVKNALGHAEQRVFDVRNGKPISQTNANAITTTWTVDAFGRVSQEQRPDGTETRFYQKQCDSSCPARATHVVITDSFQGGARYGVPTMAYLDDAGRTLRRQTWGLDGRYVVTDQRYDARGRDFETDHPRYADAAPVLATRRQYDDLNRLTAVTVFDEGNVARTSSTGYAGLRRTVINAKNQTMTTEQDALGLLAQSTDALNGATVYQREPFGNLSQVTDPKANVVQIGYDRLGRRTDLRDPDLGWIHYDTDPVGRVWRQQSPKQRSAGNATTFQFDALDRMVVRNEPDLTSTWVYDTAPKGLGQLAEAYTGPAAAKDYRRVHTYDGLGRPSSSSITLDTSYTTTTNYDAMGRVKQLLHQRGAGPVKTYDHVYSPMGYLHRIERAGVGLWQASEQDAAQRTTVAVLGNGLSERQTYNPYSARLSSATLDVAPGQSRLVEGYTYDELGNVRQRTQWWDGSGYTETFDYDGLNRLKTAQVTGQPLQSFNYDEIGNLISKSGTGTGNYSYPASGAGSVRPHAVQSIPGLGSYGYDDNGNLTSAPNSAVLTWKSFDMPDTLTRGGVASQFAYGPEHQRGRQTRSDGTVLYYAGAMEVETKAGVSTVKTYWPMGLGLEIDKPGQATEMLWVHTDRLGSVIGLTTSAGGFKEKLAYDAWGKRRTTDGSATPNTLDGQTDNRGFTGHEMLDNLDMVHMNGRIYEPAIARFVSADPLIQDPEHSQSYNRYSYVWNNPTNLTDPTGFAAQRDMGKEDFKPGNSIGDISGINLKDIQKLEVRQNADGSQTFTFYMENGAKLSHTPSSSSLEVTKAAGGVGATKGAEPAGLGLRPKIQEGIDWVVEKIGYGSISTTIGAGIGAAGTALNEFVPDSKIEVGLAVLGPLGKLGKLRAAAEGLIDPALVRFTQDSIKGALKNGGPSITELANSLRGKGGDALAATFEPIRLVLRDGVLYTLDNRRLAAFSAAGREIPYRMATAREVAKEWADKFTTTAEQGWGKFISIRGADR